MRRSLLVLASSASLLTGCLVETHPAGRVEAVQVLPEVMEVGPDGYFYH